MLEVLTSYNKKRYSKQKKFVTFCTERLEGSLEQESINHYSKFFKIIKKSETILDIKCLKKCYKHHLVSRIKFLFFMLEKLLLVPLAFCLLAGLTLNWQSVHTGFARDTKCLDDKF